MELQYVDLKLILSRVINLDFRTMLRYLKETEEAINTGVEQMKENDRFDLDAFNAFRVIVSACRAIVLSHLGFKAQVSCSENWSETINLAIFGFANYYSN